LTANMLDSIIILNREYGGKIYEQKEYEC